LNSETQGSAARSGSRVGCRRFALGGMALAACLAALMPPVAWAQSFAGLLGRALDGDPGYRSARAVVDAADARRRQALGSLLPQISLTANTNSNTRDYQTRAPLQPSAQDRYNSNAAQVEEARARHDQAAADAATAQAEAQAKLAALEQIVGPLAAYAPPFMRDDAALAEPGPDKLDAWLARATEQGPNVLAAAKALEAAGDEVRKQGAGHQPTLDFVANYGTNAQATGGFPGQAGYDIKQGAIGLQLTVPLFSGGAQAAKVDEAEAQREKARQDLEAARRGAVLATRQAWHGWHAARLRGRAGSQAVQAGAAALLAARRGVERGLKAELDALQAEQQWRAALRDFRRARYDEVIALAKLKAAAGALTQGDVRALDALFRPDEDLPQAAHPPGAAAGRAG